VTLLYVATGDNPRRLGKDAFATLRSLLTELNETPR
jgi:hypothetical protein